MYGSFAQVAFTLERFIDGLGSPAVFSWSSGVEYEVNVLDIYPLVN